MRFPCLVRGGDPQTTMGWPIVPSGLGDILADLSARYGDRLPPLVVTENGCSLTDEITADGRIDDPLRIGFLAGHLNVIADALRAGIRIDGYFIWSFLDHFEWDLGYTTRWGIVHVDFPTQRRTPKASAHWYRRLIEAWRSGL